MISGARAWLLSNLPRVGQRITVNNRSGTVTHRFRTQIYCYVQLDGDEALTGVGVGDVATVPDDMAPYVALAHKWPVGKVKL